jgi:hypothetical protein
MAHSFVSRRMWGVHLMIGRAALAALVLAVPGPRAAAFPAVPPGAAASARAALPSAKPVQTTTPELRARALMRQFPWITRFWSELQREERARAERAFRRRGQTEDFAATWDKMGLQERVLLLFGPGRTRAN